MHKIMTSQIKIVFIVKQIEQQFQKLLDKEYAKIYYKWMFVLGPKQSGQI